MRPDGGACTSAAVAIARPPQRTRFLQSWNLLRALAEHIDATEDHISIECPLMALLAWCIPECSAPLVEPPACALPRMLPYRPSTLLIHC